MTTKIEVLDMSSELDDHYLQICQLEDDCRNLASLAELALDRLRKTESYERASIEAMTIMQCASDALLLSEVAMMELDAANALAEPPAKPNVPELESWLKLCRTKEAYADTVRSQLQCFRLMAEATLALAEHPASPGVESASHLA